ncbi:hypothetical protein F4604DRAFT_1934160 [Suillus subluteus]|nr:hypothetical protein F4604DRAFT_1934160 [Suillus subluteus]
MAVPNHLRPVPLLRFFRRSRIHPRRTLDPIHSTQRSQHVDALIQPYDVPALSLSWHMKRKTGELLRILDSGSAINRVGELIGFTVIPVLVDICVALVVFVFRFEPTLGILVGVVMGCYVCASVVLTKYRTSIRKRMNERDAVTRGTHTYCVLNCETVKIKYFEGRRMKRKGIRRLLGSIRVWRMGLFLYFPLSNLSGIYRAINQSLVDSKKLLHLLNEPTEVVDEPDAKELVVSNGEVEFNNVFFSYDHQTSVVHSISFEVPCGGRVS